MPASRGTIIGGHANRPCSATIVAATERRATLTVSRGKRSGGHANRLLSATIVAATERRATFIRERHHLNPHLSPKHKVQGAKTGANAPNVERGMHIIWPAIALG